MKKEKMCMIVGMMCLALCSCGKNDTNVINNTEVIDAETIQLPGAKNEEMDQESGATQEELQTQGQTEPQVQTMDENVSELEMYQKFLGLAGEDKIFATIDSDWYERDQLGKNGKVDLQGIKDYLVYEYLQWSDKENKELTVSYAYIDCGNDGKNELAVKFTGIDIYSPNDDSFAVYVFTTRGNELYLTYSYECWARSYTEMNSLGFISGGGSSGAGDHIDENGVLDADGKYHNIFILEELSGWWINYINDTAYQDIFQGDEPEIYVDKYQIDDNEYCTYGVYEEGTEISEMSKKYIEACAEAGTHWVTDEEIENIIREKEKQLGVTEEIKAAKNFEWILIDK